MATTLIPFGDTLLASDPIPVGENEAVALFMTGADSYGYGASALIQIQDEDEEWNTIGQIGSNQTSTVISAPGTYQVVRQAGDVSFGVCQG